MALILCDQLSDRRFNSLHFSSRVVYIASAGKITVNGEVKRSGKEAIGPLRRHYCSVYLQVLRNTMNILQSE